MRVTISQYETSGKNDAHLLSHNLPAGEKNSLEQAVVWHEVKVVCCLLTPLLHTAYARWWLEQDRQYVFPLIIIYNALS